MFDSFSPLSPGITNDLTVSIATSLHQRLPFSNLVHHLSSPCSDHFQDHGSLSLSLSPCDVVCCVVRVVVVVVLLVVVCFWCVCVCLVCVCLFMCCGTLKKREKTRVWIQKRLRVYIQNVSVYAGTRTCVSTCARAAGTHWGRFERTHGDVLNPHTGGRGSSSVLLTKICPRRVITWPQRSTKETRGSYPFSV